MSLRDMRNKEIEEGDMVMFTPDMIPAPIMNGIVLSMSAPMVKYHPQLGEVVSHSVKVAFVFNMEVQKGVNLPMPILDKHQEASAVEFLKELTEMIEKLKAGGGGGGGGSIISA